MKRLIAISLAFLLILAGCSNSPPPVSWKDNPTTAVTVSEPPADRTWISPGKVMIANFYPGARAEYELSVHNGKDTKCQFQVKYRYPDHTGEDYEKPPAEAENWVIIADTTPVVMPRETLSILVALVLPDDAITPERWEFWISVIDTTQAGMVRTELCTRWLVTMR